jgi:NOL1/NOP2/fmu family ribosome biogenesis protein
MRKKGESVAPFVPAQPSPSDKELADFYEFCKNYLNTEIKSPLIIHGSSLMAVPEGLPPLKGIRVMRSGLYLGELKKNRFEPSQAFAMTLKKDEVRLTIDFKPEDEGLKQYLRGDSFTVDCADGWALVCVCGYPLGWGKVQKGRLKNKYLPSWMN